MRCTALLEVGLPDFVCSLNIACHSARLALVKGEPFLCVLPLVVWVTGKLIEVLYCPLGLTCAVQQHRTAALLLCRPKAFANGLAFRTCLSDLRSHHINCKAPSPELRLVGISRNSSIEIV